jgi:hypothetical protein
MVSRMHSLLNHTLIELNIGAGGQGGIFLASILNMPQKFQTCVETFNKELPGIASAYPQVQYVPMNENTGLCGDHDRPFCAAGHVHPTSQGYLKMASEFALAIQVGAGTQSLLYCVLFDFRVSPTAGKWPVVGLGRRPPAPFLAFGGFV